jgi:hypothetical protein
MNNYDIDREFDYSRIKSIVVKSLEKIAKEALKNIHNDVLKQIYCDSSIFMALL